jgi:hypothetical protein
MGLSGMKPMTDQEGSQVRGQFFFFPPNPIDGIFYPPQPIYPPHPTGGIHFFPPHPVQLPFPSGPIGGKS